MFCLRWAGNTFFSPGVIRNYRPRLLFPDLKIQLATVESSFTHDAISGDVWSSVLWYAMASLKTWASEIKFNHGSGSAGEDAPALGF